MQDISSLFEDNIYVEVTLYILECFSLKCLIALFNRVHDSTTCCSFAVGAMSQSQPLQPEVKMDSNDANTNTQASSITKRKRKPMDKRPEVWDHFTKFTDMDGSSKAKCNYCAREYFSDSSKNGNSNLCTHLKTCNRLPLSGDSKQTQLTLQSGGWNELLKKAF